MTELSAKKSDLLTRTVSAMMMLLVTGTALWAGGWAWTLFVAVVAMAVLWEWRNLTRAFAASPVHLGLWNAAGFVYIATAAAVLLVLRSGLFPIWTAIAVVLGVIATDVGAYFAGRAIGGPRIAPRISPSKTWAGLAGGMVGASLVLAIVFLLNDPAIARAGGQGLAAADWSEIAAALPLGAGLAVVAQAGDFFESWMKRKAGVKDSGRLIPGHGGLFDRVDGLLAVLAVGGAAAVVAIGAGWR